MPEDKDQQGDGPGEPKQGPQYRDPQPPQGPQFPAQPPMGPQHR